MKGPAKCLVKVLQLPDFEKKVGFRRWRREPGCSMDGRLRGELSGGISAPGFL